MKTSTSPGLREWERTMRIGADAARSGRSLLAESLYLHALALSRALLEHALADDEPSADDRVAAFVATHLNLADLHAQDERSAAASAWICAAHCTLMSLVRDPATERALRQAALRHSRETHAALLEHLAQHGADDAVLAALRAGCMPFTATRPPLDGPMLH